MPRFKYKAKKGIDEIVEGFITANNQTEAVYKLSEQDLYPIELEPESAEKIRGRKISYGRASSAGTAAGKSFLSGFLKKKVNSKEMLVFIQKLTTLTKAKIELLPSLDILRGQITNLYFKEIITKIRDLVEGGKSFSQSLDEFSADFPSLLVSIIKAGEASGNMQAALSQISFFLQRRESLKNKVIGALIYPAILLFIGLISIFVILNFVIPRLKGLFGEMKGDFPIATKVILKISAFTNENWLWVFLALGGLILLGVFLKGTKIFFKIFKWVIGRLPVIKTLIKNQELAGFSQSLTLLLGSGVPALRALQIAGLSIEDIKMRKEIESVVQKVRNGHTISSGMEGLRTLPDFFVKMIIVGEESGRLGEVLAEITDSYTQQIDAEINIITSVLEPALIFILGGVLGLIVLSILLPIFQLTQMIR